MAYEQDTPAGLSAKILPVNYEMKCRGSRLEQQAQSPQIASL